MITDNLKLIYDWASIATVVLTLVQLLPAFAALFSIIWLWIQMYHWSHTSPTPLARWMGRFTGRPLE